MALVEEKSGVILALLGLFWATFKSEREKRAVGEGPVTGLTRDGVFGDTYLDAHALVALVWFLSGLLRYVLQSGHPDVLSGLSRRGLELKISWNNCRNILSAQLLTFRSLLCNSTGTCPPFR